MMKKQYLCVPVVCVWEQHLLEGQSVKSEEAVQDTCKGEGVLALLLTASLLAFHSFNLEVWGCSEANKPSKKPLGRCGSLPCRFGKKQPLALQDEAQGTPSGVRWVP